MRAAITFDLDMTTLPKPYLNRNPRTVPNRIWDQVIRRDLARVDRIYGPDSHRAGLLMALEKRDIADARRHGALSLGGGIAGPVRWGSIFIWGGTASVTCRATGWAKSEGYHNGHKFIYGPRNMADYTFTLGKHHGRWLVTDERFTFVPGYGGNP